MDDQAVASSRLAETVSAITHRGFVNIPVASGSSHRLLQLHDRAIGLCAPFISHTPADRIFRCVNGDTSTFQRSSIHRGRIISLRTWVIGRHADEDGNKGGCVISGVGILNYRFQQLYRVRAVAALDAKLCLEKPRARECTGRCGRDCHPAELITVRIGQVVCLVEQGISDHLGRIAGICARFPCCRSIVFRGVADGLCLLLETHKFKDIRVVSKREGNATDLYPLV